MKKLYLATIMIVICVNPANAGCYLGETCDSQADFFAYAREMDTQARLQRLEDQQRETDWRLQQNEYDAMMQHMIDNMNYAPSPYFPSFHFSPSK
jgi:hypothetical protein